MRAEMVFIARREGDGGRFNTRAQSRCHPLPETILDARQHLHYLVFRV
jgi:hypothetical protein